jgi:hypothetical protein
VDCLAVADGATTTNFDVRIHDKDATTDGGRSGHAGGDWSMNLHGERRVGPSMRGR